jgi:hypothetical protein
MPYRVTDTERSEIQLLIPPMFTISLILLLLLVALNHAGDKS